MLDNNTLSEKVEAPQSYSALNNREKSFVVARLCGWQIINVRTEKGWTRVLGNDQGMDLGFRPPSGAGLAPLDQEITLSNMIDLYSLDPATTALYLSGEWIDSILKAAEEDGWLVGPLNELAGLTGRKPVSIGA